MKLDTLYKKTKTGAIQVCNISIDKEVFTVEHGQLDGVMQTQPTTCDGKNHGRANETTPEEQAILEAKSKHKKKMDTGYVLDPSGETKVKLPQKVKCYVGQEKNVPFPCYSTNKLNGINGTYWRDADRNLTLTSRGGKEYPPIPHLEEAVHKEMDRIGTDCLNGELYIHGEHLQDITSAVKKPKELSKRLIFCIFELPNVDRSYGGKTGLMSGHPFDESVIFAWQTRCNSHEDIEACYEDAINHGCEGTVIYDPESRYQFNTRSSHVWKYKKALSAEYKILSMELDKNGHPVFTMEIPDSDKTFKVKPKGTSEEREAIAKAFDADHKGRWYTIEYEMLSKDSVPLKPVGIGLRDCDEDGRPVE